MRRRDSISVAVAAGLAVLPAALATPAAAEASDGIVSKEIPAPQARPGPAAIAAAEPPGFLRSPAPAARSDAVAPGPASSGTRDGPPRSIPGRRPLLDAGGSVGISDRAVGAGFRRFSSEAVADPTAYPNSTWGKVVGRMRGIGSFGCSATVVPARNRSVLFTAGHCVKQPRGPWARQFTFIPAYAEGAEPFGRWRARTLLTSRSWARDGNPNFDYAAVVLRRSGGRRVERAVGSLGFAYNQRPRQSYRAVGYPFNRLDGEGMWECASGLGGRDPAYLPPGPRAIGIGCDMLGGASGGGWSIRKNRLASVTSFGYEGRSNELYGPHFDKRANRLRRAAARG